MPRLVLTFVAWMSLVSGASATLSPGEGHAKLANEHACVQTAPESGAEFDFDVTEETEVLLNGEPCRYEDVPAHARIVRLDVAADKKTALKVHFRTGR